MSKEYAVMGARLECTHGTAPSNLVILPNRTVTLTGKLKANISDCKPMVNVMPFAMCQSPANPAVIAAMGAPVPCTPACSIWIGGKPDALVQGMPALLTGDKAVCPLGVGMIEVKNSGQGSAKEATPLEFDDVNLDSIESRSVADSGNLHRSNSVGAITASSITATSVTSTEYNEEELNLINAVLAEEQRLKNSGLTKDELGPAVAGVYDKSTGKMYFAINDNEGKIPEELHPLIEDKVVNMPLGVLNSYTKTKGAGSHAEVYAVNEALLANLDAKPADLIIYVNFTRPVSSPAKKNPFPRCKHCLYILQDFEAISDRE